jgi:hypothetical protein
MTVVTSWWMVVPYLSDVTDGHQLTLLQFSLYHPDTTIIFKMSSVMLSFGGTSANGAWDDRELVKSYDAAMEEFHVSTPCPFCHTLTYSFIIQVLDPG